MCGITATLVVLLSTAFVAHVVRLNYVMGRTPRAARAHVSEPLTADDIRETYERVRREGIDWRPGLPPRKERRYIVVGGSGTVGGQLALDLLQMGVPPAAIRLMDIRRPARDEFKSGPASEMAFVSTDVTSESDVLRAFGEPWHEAVARLPLTVFHTVALIRPFERSEIFYERCSRVNVAGTANVLAAAQKAGAGIFIYTSSCHAAVRSTGWFFPLWLREPRNFAQVVGDDDFFRPLPRPRDFASNYARSKAEGERLVCGADDADDDGRRGQGMRTAAIRPGNGVYGHKDDVILGRLIRLRRVPTYSAPWVHNWVNVHNVTQAHLRLEDALLGEHASKVAGRPFMVSDEGPGLRFQDVYDILSTTCSTGMRVDYPPPVLLLLLAYAIEAYCLLLARAPPLLRKLLLLLTAGEPREPVLLLQPALFSSSVTSIIDDSAARRTPAQGGLGYAPACTTLEGMCLQVVHWNEWVEEKRHLEEGAVE
ncbi:hypothetical protein JDV02_001294 [Purpureocillium takamizusanense]|uniref:3-beta hydroxysteroid dehydrogenase/isomerase domain-containing protein n=1 Tax=Purpureocillium takamizusanense TaxID=2060973 RepID=A0A9Q8Q974_9HYPO|nr:uncharacterized protein JDV02_001294 [Purpureocillium takamizusanense]UNI14692.1 hypothetical protein JDV02_001294 [Purpureocillium takamizusanense]